MRYAIFLAAFIVIPAYPQAAITGGNGVCDAFGCLGMNAPGDYDFQKDEIIFFIAGVPYSGHVTGQIVRKPADGTNPEIRNFQSPMTYRDSMGRTRTEVTQMQALIGGHGEPLRWSFPQIDDPVAGYRIILDPIHRIAHRMRVEAYPTNPALPAEPVRRDGVTTVIADLGTATVLGITALGTRDTTTFPAGTYPGSDKFMTVVSERWYSLKYDLTLKNSRLVPESETTETVEDFSTAEPEPSLFTIPAGYQIVDETDRFSITIPRNAQ